MSDEPNASSSHWARQKEAGSYAGLLVMLWAYRLGGRWLFTLLLYPVIAYFFLSSSVARHASLEFLQMAHAAGSSALPNKPGYRDSFRHFMCFGHAVLDKVAVWLGGLGQQEVRFPNRPWFREQIDTGKGGVILASHLGNLDICRYLSKQTPALKLNILVHTRHAQRFNELLNRFNEETNISFVQVDTVGPDTAMLLQQKVAAGEFVAIVGDRIPVQENTRWLAVPFLGRSAEFPVGPFILAALLRCPVYTLFCIKRERGYQVDIDSFAEQLSLSRKTRQQDLERYIKAYADRLQEYGIEYPYQWFNFYRFWEQHQPKDRIQSS